MNLQDEFVNNFCALFLIFPDEGLCLYKPKIRFFEFILTLQKLYKYLIKMS